MSYSSSMVELSMTEIESYINPRTLMTQGSGKKSGKYLRFYCPIHGSDKQRSLSVNPENGYFLCFSCGAWGYLSEYKEKWIEEKRREKMSSNNISNNNSYNNRSTKNLYNQKEAEIEINAKLETRHKKLSKYIKGYQKQLVALNWENKKESIPINYLKSRGINNLDVLQQYGVGYAPNGNWMHWCNGKKVRQWKYGYIVFPETMPDGTLINLYGRAVGKNVPKDKRHDHIMTGKKGIFNAESLLKKGTLFICEGVFDALSLIFSGYENVCAMIGVYGLNISTIEAEKVVLCFDNDETGQKRSLEIAEALTMLGKKAYFLDEDFYCNYKDLNQLYYSEGNIDLGNWNI